MNKKELEAKLKRSLQVLLYLFEVKTKIKTVAKNINFNYWNIDTNGAIYFELDIKGESSDPDPYSLAEEIKRVSDRISDFFGKYMLDDEKLTFVDIDDDTDDMIGLLMNVNFNWNGGEQDNTNFTFAFEYNFYDQEITE
jgi:hypothetical protein